VTHAQEAVDVSQDKLLTVPGTDRQARLEKWWATLDDERRHHARACVAANLPDDSFLAGLRDAGIGLANVGWVAGGATAPHIPRAILKFVEDQPPV
jgi:hypothetical protein